MGGYDPPWLPGPWLSPWLQLIRAQLRRAVMSYRPQVLQAASEIKLPVNRIENNCRQRAFNQECMTVVRCGVGTRVHAVRVRICVRASVCMYGVWVRLLVYVCGLVENVFDCVFVRVVERETVAKGREAQKTCLYI